jgi:DNA-directed RNA polymerase specialized sigma subunit
MKTAISNYAARQNEKLVAYAMPLVIAAIIAAQYVKTLSLF